MEILNAEILNLKSSIHVKMHPAANYDSFIFRFFNFKKYLNGLGKANFRRREIVYNKLQKTGILMAFLKLLKKKQ